MPSSPSERRALYQLGSLEALMITRVSPRLNGRSCGRRERESRCDNDRVILVLVGSGNCKQLQKWYHKYCQTSGNTWESFKQLHMHNFYYFSKFIGTCNTTVINKHMHACIVHVYTCMYMYIYMNVHARCTQLNLCTCRYRWYYNTCTSTPAIQSMYERVYTCIPLL